MNVWGEAREPTNHEPSRWQKAISAAGALFALSGALASVWLVLRAVWHNVSPASAGMLTLCVLSPFAVSMVRCRLSRRWSPLPRLALVALTLGLLVGTLAVYGSVAVSSDETDVTFAFVVVPLGSWVLIATVVPIVALMSRRLSRYALVRWTVRGVAGAFLLVVVGISSLLGLLLFDHHQDTVLPAPTGPFSVGRTTFVWQREQADLRAPPGAQDVLLGWIWYPAEGGQRSPAVDYLPAAWRAAMDSQSGVLLSQFLTRDRARVEAHGLQDAPVSPEQKAYPVVLMRGGGAALAADYTTLAEDLASHGYVVVGFDVPSRSWVAVLPDGTVVPRAPQNNLDNFSGEQADKLADALAQAWTADCRFVIDQLERLNASEPTGKFRGRLDLERLGAFGHSLGGATALLLCHDDARCKAGINLDGAPLGPVIAAGITQPFMFVLSDHRGESGNGQPQFIRNARANIRSIYDRLPGDRRMMVEIRGANHFLFSDNGALLKSPLAMRMLRRLGIVGIEGRRQLELTAHYIRAFFDVHLKGTSRPSHLPGAEAVDARPRAARPGEAWMAGRPDGGATSRPVAGAARR